MDANAFKTDFLNQLHSPQQVQVLFNHLPDVYYFVKDRESRFVMANDVFVRQCGAACEQEIVGRTDFDYFPTARAEQYVRDDKFVMDTRRSIINRVELAPDPGNSINWFVTTKVPLYAFNRKIIGIAGTSRDITRAKLMLRPYTDMRQVLEFVRDNFGRTISVRELAALAHLSVSQFERRFRSVFHISPLKHIMNVRISAACLRLTTTNETIASVALDCGFYDHPHLTRCFRKHMQISPKQYRRRYGR